MISGYLTPDEIPTDTKSRALLIPDNPLIWGAVYKALFDLACSENWQPYGAVTPDEIAYAMLEMLETMLEG